MISISLILFSCIEKTKYHWEAGISAPIFYPVADCFVDFGETGNSSRMPFDNGWGDTYGSVVSTDKFKKIPKEVYITYNSAVENYIYEGKVKLSQEKLKELFQKFDTEKNFFSKLVVGMAPGGWIRVWFQTRDEKLDKNVSIEIAKAKLKKVRYDESADERYKVKNLKNWGKYYTYWNHHGIPYEAWAENEKEYNIIFDFKKPNPNNEVLDSQYSSLDGTYYFRSPMNRLVQQKLPADFVAVWKSKKSDVYYDTHISFPKNFPKIIKNRNPKEIILTLKIEDNNQYGVVYITTNKKQEKLLRFKNIVSKDNVIGKSDFATEIEYFIP